MRKLLILLLVLSTSYCFAQKPIRPLNSKGDITKVLGELKVDSAVTFSALKNLGSQVLSTDTAGKVKLVPGGGGGAIANGLNSIGGITLIDSTVTLLHDIIWTINGVTYSYLTNTSFIIHTADSGYFRRDLIYADTTGVISKIQGIEDSVIATAPALPPNSVVVTIVDVYGSQIVLPTPIIIGAIPNWNQTMIQGNTTTQNATINYNGGGFGMNVNSVFDGFSGYKVNNSSAVGGGGLIAYNDIGHHGQYFMGSSTNAYAPDEFLLRTTGKGMRLSVDSGDVAFYTGLLYSPRPSVRLGAFKPNGDFILDKYKNNVSEDSVLSTDTNGKFKLVAKGNIGCAVTFYVTPDSLYLVKDSCGSIIDSTTFIGDGGSGGSGGAYIPLSGTAVGSPVTGNIELNESKKIFQGDNTYGAFLDFEDGGIYMRGNGGGRFTQLVFTQAGHLSFDTDEPTSPGISGGHDFTPNITALDYTQKKYVDTKGDSLRLEADSATVSMRKNGVFVPQFHIPSSGVSSSYRLPYNGIQTNYLGGDTTYHVLPFKSLTTTGTSGVATLSSGVLNIPNYATPTTYTASNGLTKVGNDIQLGGTMSANDTIGTNGHLLNVSGISNVGYTPIFKVSTTSTSGFGSYGFQSDMTGTNTNSRAIGGTNDKGVGVVGTSNSNFGVLGASTSGIGMSGVSSTNTGISASSDLGKGISGSSGSNTGIYGFSGGNTSYAGEFEVWDSIPMNGIRPVLHSMRNAIAGFDPLNGYGQSFDFELQSYGSQRLSNQLISKWTTANDATRKSEFSITGVNNGTTYTLIKASGSGIFNLPLGLTNYANNAAAISGGLSVGDLYRNGDVVQIVH